MKLRYYQTDLLDGLEQGWSRGHRCQVVRSGTGTGKTVTMAHAVHDHGAGAIVMAHRSEILSQLSLALAREGVRHRVLGPDTLVKLCMRAQIDALGTHYVNPGAVVGVVSAQTLASLKGEEAFLSQVTLAVNDEGHHYVKGGIFEKAVNRTPRARLILPTATPVRTDGRGLGRHADGWADNMVLGPSEARMMAEGFLCQYRIYAPPSTFHREALSVGSSGEFKADTVKQETRRSSVLGDAVKHYVRLAWGKRGITFCDSIENATTMCQNYRDAGVPTEILTGDTHADTRANILRRFARGEVWQLCNVALIDEGVDIPSVEVVSDCAATTSLGRYRQRFGRGWRPAEGKSHMIYLDHVGNVLAHGLPDAHRTWSLNRRERRAKAEPNDEMPVRTCTNPEGGAPVDGVPTPCASTYERALPACPYCGFVPVPARRDGPEYVDGDLHELDEATMAVLRGEIAKVDGPAYAPVSAGPEVVGAIRKRHAARQVAQHGLRDAMALWIGWQTAQGRGQSESWRRWYLRYGVDVATAQTLGASDAATLEAKVRAELDAHGIIAALGN